MHALHFVCPWDIAIYKCAVRDLMMHTVMEKMLKENSICILSHHSSDESNCFSGKSLTKQLNLQWS